MKKLPILILVLGGVMLLCIPFASGTPEFSRKEDKKCVFCHTAMGKPDLNDAGKYYKENGTLKGYDPKKKP